MSSYLRLVRVEEAGGGEGKKLRNKKHKNNTQSHSFILTFNLFEILKFKEKSTNLQSFILLQLMD